MPAPHEVAAWGVYIQTRSPRTGVQQGARPTLPYGAEKEGAVFQGEPWLAGRQAGSCESCGTVAAVKGLLVEVAKPPGAPLRPAL